MKNLTEVVFILDRSGSMSGMEDDTIGGFNSMIDKQNKAEGEALVSTILFDHDTEVIHDRVPLKEIKKMTERDYWTRGSTALLDAIGKSINHIKNIHKYAREEDRPDRTLFCITTDGMENSSVIYSYQEIKKMVEAQKELGWEFLFLGANIDAIETAGHLGISRNRAANFHQDHAGISQSYNAFGDAMCCFMADGIIADNWKSDVEEDFKQRGGNPFSKGNSKGKNKSKPQNLPDLNVDEIFKDFFGDTLKSDQLDKPEK